MTRASRAIGSRRAQPRSVDAGTRDIAVPKAPRKVAGAATAHAPATAKKTALARKTASGIAPKKNARKSAASPTKKPAKRANRAGSSTASGKPARKLGGAGIRRPKRRMSPAEVEALFERFSEASPAPTTELEFSTPYELLVAVALSAQATDISVNKATRRLFPVANTPRAIANLGVDGIAPYIATINFNRTKARNVVAMAEQLIERHGGEVPLEREELEALAGVGRKTANVVLNTAFGEMTLAVDTHIFRVSNRTGLAPGRDVRAVEEELLRVVPKRYLQNAHHWLLLHGRYVCKARLPDCPRCTVRDLCHYPDKTPGDPPPLEVAPSRTRRAR